jgi:peroxiredoxin
MKYFITVLLSLMLLPGQAVFASPERVGDFALLDQMGEFHQFSRYGHAEALVLYSHSIACEASQADLSSLESLRSELADTNVSFFLINSSGDDLKAVRAFAEHESLGFPILMDSSQLVAKTLKVSKAGEVLVLDPQTLSVVYRGSVRGALSSQIKVAAANTVVDTLVEEAAGCALDMGAVTLAGSEVPDYASEVAPVIVENCANCHREGGIGPFAMDSHLMLQGWSPMIREVLLTKRMPPMQVDSSVGHFNNATYISDESLQTLVNWIDAGAPRGIFQADPLSNLSYPDLKSWQLGEPDFIVQSPRQEIPATGVLEYINVDVALPFTEDKWVRAVQFIPGDETVLHHLLTYVTAPNESFDGGESNPTSTVASRFLEGYAPGKVEAMVFPEDTGVLIPAGHKLSMQFHFTTNGRATSDQTTLGMYFYDEPPAHENLTRTVAGFFVIPPHASNHEVRASYVFQEPVVVNGLRAHMHFRGRDMRFSVEYPDGTREELLNVPNYSYAWQPTYQLSEHKYLPAGTRVHVTGAFDNSTFNPANPDPDAEVRFGLQSWEEMFMGYWTYYAAND